MQNVLAVLFQVESEGYQAITTLKQNSVAENYAILQMALVKRTGNNVSLCDSFTSDIHSKDDTVRGGMIGAMLGVLGGPIGMLLMGSTGAMIGSSIDTGDAVATASLLGQVADKLLDGEVALIMLAEEKTEDELDARLTKFKVEIVRYDAAVVAAEIEEANRAEKEMQRQARIQLRESRKAERKEKAAEKREKVKTKTKEALKVGTLSKTRVALRADHKTRKMLLRGSNNELLIDLDGDKQADIALVDVDKGGNLDRICVDLTGNGYFDLYVDDTDNNGIPDRIFLVDEENDKTQELAFGPEAEEQIMVAAKAVAQVLEAQEIIADELDARLRDMEISIHSARRQLNRH